MATIKGQYLRLKDRIHHQIALISKKICKQEKTKELTNQEVALSLYQIASHEPIPDKVFEQVDRLICKLNIEQVNLIRMHYFEGKTIREIAGIKGKSETGVWKDIHHLLEIMRKD